MKLSDFLNPPPRTTEVVPDIENPRWTDSAQQAGLLDEAGQMTFKAEHHGHAGIRTIHGALDLVTDIAEEITDWEHKIESENAEDRLPENLRRVLAHSPRPIVVLSYAMPAAAFHAETITVPAAGAWTLLSARSDRLWIEICNQGANPALISHTDDPNVNVTGSIAAIALPSGANNSGNPRRFAAGGKVWVYSALGTTIDYIETYGVRNLPLDWINP